MTENEKSTSEETESQQLAKRLREVREYLDLSQQFVADKTGIPGRRSPTSSAERGRSTAWSCGSSPGCTCTRSAYFLGDEEAGDDVRALARAVTDLTEGDRAEVVRFAQFLRYSADADRKKQRR